MRALKICIVSSAADVMSCSPLSSKERDVKDPTVGSLCCLNTREGLNEDCNHTLELVIHSGSSDERGGRRAMISGVSVIDGGSITADVEGGDAILS